MADTTLGGILGSPDLRDLLDKQTVLVIKHLVVEHGLTMSREAIRLAEAGLGDDPECVFAMGASTEAVHVAGLLAYLAGETGDPLIGSKLIEDAAREQTTTTKPLFA